MTLEPMHIDGALYVGIGVFTALLGALGSDEAAKYIAPQVLFWARTAAQCGLAGAASAKMFRSQSFADYTKKKGETEMLTRAQAGLGSLHKG